MKHLNITSSEQHKLTSAIIALESIQDELDTQLAMYGSIATESVDDGDGKTLLQKGKEGIQNIYKWIKEFCKKVVERVKAAAKYVSDVIGERLRAASAAIKASHRKIQNALASKSQVLLTEMFNNSDQLSQMVIRAFATSEPREVVQKIIDGLRGNTVALRNLTRVLSKISPNHDEQTFSKLEELFSNEVDSMVRVRELANDLWKKYSTQGPLEPADMAKFRVNEFQTVLTIVQVKYIQEVMDMTKAYDEFTTATTSAIERLTKTSGDDAQIALCADASKQIAKLVESTAWAATTTNGTNTLATGIAGVSIKIAEFVEGQKEEQK